MEVFDVHNRTGMDSIRVNGTNDITLDLFVHYYGHACFEKLWSAIAFAYLLYMHYEFCGVLLNCSEKKRISKIEWV